MCKTLKYIKISVIILLIIILSINTVEAKTKYTVDDLRDIVGKERIDSVYSESEIEEIIMKYNNIEKHNLYAKMFQLGKQITLDEEVEKKINEKQQRIEFLSTELEKQYKEGSSIDKILKLKTQLESEVHKLKGLNDIGYYVEVEYKENKWSEEYEKVQETIERMSNDFEIGDIGTALRSPLYYGFIITSPYGFRIDPITKDKLSFHSGIDLAAPLDDYVFSVWNGIVSNVYESEGGGKTVEISHGTNLKTRYLHLNKIDVSIGQEVSQYDIIGGAGTTGLRSTGVHLHLEVELDGETINPLYVFGNMGLRAFKEYISYNPDRNRELRIVESEIKGAPSKEREESNIKPPQYYRPLGEMKEGSIITYVDVDTGEIKPFTYDIPLGLSKEDKELVEYIDKVIKEREEKEDKYLDIGIVDEEILEEENNDLIINEEAEVIEDTIEMGETE